MDKVKNITRETHIIDAGSAPMGRIATRISVILRGKHKADFAPNVDSGDFVVVENIVKMKLTGKKAEQKVYYSHSGYQGGLKTKTIKSLLKNDPAEIMRKAVYNMLPKNKLRDKQIKRLTVK